MRELQQSTCPSCGLETLETIHIGQPAASRGEQGSIQSLSMVMFECNGCLWRGSSATLNTV